eukprot:435959-Prymnesium_polylepis.1
MQFRRRRRAAAALRGRRRAALPTARRASRCRRPASTPRGARAHECLHATLRARACACACACMACMCHVHVSQSECSVSRSTQPRGAPGVRGTVRARAPRGARRVRAEKDGDRAREGNASGRRCAHLVHVDSFEEPGAAQALEVLIKLLAHEAELRARRRRATLRARACAAGGWRAWCAMCRARVPPPNCARRLVAHTAS